MSALLRHQYCAVEGHDWSYFSHYIDKPWQVNYRTCGNCHLTERTDSDLAVAIRSPAATPDPVSGEVKTETGFYFEGCDCADCEAQRSPAATAASTSQEGGEIIMESITINGVEYTLTPKAAEAAAPRVLTINRPHVVYDVEGNRVDGYKFESRARRNNDARFAGVGYWLGNANTGDFEFVQA